MFRRAVNLVTLVAGLGVSLTIPAFSQTVELADGTTVTVTPTYDRSVGRGPAQRPPGIEAQVATSLAFYTNKYSAFGKNLTFNIVGTDPSLGAATTVIPSVIVPLKFVFPVAGNLSLDGTNVVGATENSPIFQLADYTTGGTDLGITQFGDAMQRAEFWNLPGFSQNGYHVLLGLPVIAPTVTINVVAGKGNLYRLLSNGQLVGVLDNAYFNSVLAALYPSYTANEVPIFLTDNVFLGQNGLIQNCCTLGFHSSESGAIATARTWIYAAYTEPGLFDSILDVQPLSHELVEWLNDPYVGGSLFGGGVNLIPPAVLPGQGGACIPNFETGDPLEAPPVAFVQTTNGTTYHLQDEVFLGWYLHGASFSVNGWYTFLNSFSSPSQLCGPG